MTIGISSAGISVPIRRLPVIDTVSQWNNTSADLIVKQFGTECRTSLGSDEDTLTLGHMKPLVIAWITQELTRQMSMQCSSALLHGR